MLESILGYMNTPLEGDVKFYFIMVCVSFVLIALVWHYATSK